MVGLTFGTAAKAILPSAANAARVPTSATIRASGLVRSYQMKPASRPTAEQRERTELPGHAGSSIRAPGRISADAVVGQQHLPGTAEDSGRLGGEVRPACQSISAAVPSAITRPSATSTTRSANSAANSGSWVATTTANPTSVRTPARSSFGGPIHAACRLVEAEHRRSLVPGRIAEHDRERQALLLTTAEITRVAIAETSEPEPGQRDRRRLLANGLVHEVVGWILQQQGHTAAALDPTRVSA